MRRRSVSARPGDRRYRRHWTPPGACDFCERVPWSDDDRGCDLFDIKGLPRVAHAWPEPETAEEIDLFSDTNPCQCGAPVGGYHHYECHLEICPWSDTHPDDGEQLLYCGCFA